MKSRQIGMSDAIAFEMVIVASGLVRLVNRWMRDNGHEWRVLPHNCNVVSKRDTDAKDVIAKSKAWVERLRLIPSLRPWLEQPEDAGWSATKIAFRKSGNHILSETQNPDAARSKTGHLYLDEFAFYRYEAEIWTGALPSIESNPGLRVSIVSTPNGTNNQYYRVYHNDQELYSTWSKHKVSIYDAVDAGYPVDPDEIKSKKTADDFAQENNCSFLGAENDYFPIDLLNDAYGHREKDGELWFGVDVASIVDTTAVVLMRKVGKTIWIGDGYIIARTPYETNENRERFRLGQNHIVDALIQQFGPRVVRMDVTGDRAREVVGQKSLYTLMLRMQSGAKLAPQRITKEYKDEWVQRVKVALQTGRLRFEFGRKDYVYTKRGEGDLRGAIKYDKRISPDFLPQFMADCWEAHGFDFLRSDFQKVHRKWLGPNVTTFDTRRDGNGHGDAFWATLIGFSGISRAQAEERHQQATNAHVDDYVEPEYLDYF